ncbi:hypothetical protein, partial [Embleya sp. NPDC005575]|uniref:hypothetical protein n=1 Tax=Embleya sp. NPDC005575 TaxID=3156892 RepID=UPI0033A535FB
MTGEAESSSTSALLTAEIRSTKGHRVFPDPRRDRRDYQGLGVHPEQREYPMTDVAITTTGSSPVE